jgi:hypothetical protein
LPLSELAPNRVAEHRGAQHIIEALLAGVTLVDHRASSKAHRSMAISAPVKLRRIRRAARD